MSHESIQAGDFFAIEIPLENLDIRKVMDFQGVVVGEGLQVLIDGKRTGVWLYTLIARVSTTRTKIVDSGGVEYDILRRRMNWHDIALELKAMELNPVQ